MRSPNPAKRARLASYKRETSERVLNACRGKRNALGINPKIELVLGGRNSKGIRMQINGFEIIGMYVLPNNEEKIILGRRELPSGQTEWVTAYCDNVESPKHWASGNYTTNWNTAFETFKSRIVR
jgi:hypothetical protein